MSQDDMASELARRDRAAGLGDPDSTVRATDAAPVMARKVYADGSERHGAEPFPDESPIQEAARLNREANPQPPQDTFARQEEARLKAEAAAANKPTILPDGSKLNDTIVSGTPEGQPAAGARPAPTTPAQIQSPQDAHDVNLPPNPAPDQPISLPGNIPGGIVTGQQLEGTDAAEALKEAHKDDPIPPTTAGSGEPSQDGTPKS